MRASVFFAALFVAFVSAQDTPVTHVITVGGNTTTDPEAVYNPREIKAALGDIVLFNFTMGNHTVTQSVFAAPCVPAHVHNVSLNGFDSGFRDAGDGQAVTILTVPITADLVNTTIWFFDYGTCGKGGVGGINVNDSSLESLAGFTRNAIRLNGTQSTTASHSGTASAPGSSSTTGSSSSSARRTTVLGALAAVPFFIAALVL